MGGENTGGATSQSGYEGGVIITHPVGGSTMDSMTTSLWGSATSHITVLNPLHLHQVR